ncbi:hypothetical protein B0H16DRAFT_974331 [Mycena metata]|uniref:Uncharacterized protein n=1 Tax=Mycena metata TaxID=1033252 RepID=A0AAD7N4Q6_9AGAR|nr:hypothetical protein B0H16DRAFT_974331 [Mycena metata]
MPPRPPPAPPAGFAWLAKLSAPRAWTYLNQGTGGVYQVANAVGTDDAVPCIALYVRLNQNDLYVAHVDSNVQSVKTDIPAITTATRAHWQAVVKAHHIVINQQYLSYFMVAGEGDPVFAEGFTAGIIAELGGEPVQPWSTLKGYTGFIYPSQAPASTPLLIQMSQTPGNFNWQADHVAGADAWTLQKNAGVITF